MMRTRTRTTEGQSTYSWHHTRWEGTYSEPWKKIIDSDNSGTFTSSLVTETFSDVSTPHFNRLSARGLIINNPMVQTKSTVLTPALSMYQHQVTYSVTGSPPKNVYYGWLTSGTIMSESLKLLTQALSAPDPGYESLRDQAITSAFSKTAGNNAMIGVTAGEFKETVSSFRNLLYRAVRIAFALKRFDLKVLAKEVSPKEIADRYMEARYAFRPLYYEAQQILTALACEDKRKRWTCRGGASGSTTDSDEYEWAYHPNVHFVLNRSCTVEVTARAGVLAEIAEYSSCHNWGLNTPLSTVWELIPLSFVVDWFCNVGKVIATYEPQIGVNHLASWVVVTKTTAHTVSLVNAIPLWPTENVYAKTTNWSGTHTSVTVHKERIPNPSVPTLPRFKLSLDAYKLLDLGLILKSTWKSLLGR